jgi:hypothetical protein
MKAPATPILDTPSSFLNLDDPIAAYRGNPLIGSLGPIRTSSQIASLLTRKPKYDQSERGLAPHFRFHAAFALRELFLPGIPHMAAVRETDLLIRQSYKNRNPLDRRYRAMVAQERNLSKNGLPLPEHYKTLPQLGAAAIGPPGTGKTLTMDFAVQNIPPVIEHAYVVDGVRVAFKQLPYLKINLFQDGSLKSFGREIFEQAEQTLSIPLAREWGVDRANGNLIQSLYFQLCREYNIGLFILDEFQLISSSHDGTRKALSYFVRLMNCIGVAVIVIGTPLTAALLKENLAASRRFVSSIPPYTAFSEGPLWRAFFEQVYRYQYVKEMDSRDEIASAVLRLSGGIPDLAIKLFLLSQMRLIGRKLERLTPKVIHDTSTLLFYTLQDRLVELKGQAPETADIASLARKADDAFKELAKRECERVGGDASDDLSGLRQQPLEIVGDGEVPLAAKMKAISKEHNPVAALEKLGVIAHPE